MLWDTNGVAAGGNNSFMLLNLKGLRPVFNL
jgi:hypothetical protein